MLVAYIMSRVFKMELVLSITFFAIHGVACVRLANASLCGWEDIFIPHLIIIIKSYCFHLSVAACLRWLFYQSLSSITYIYPGNTGTLFPLLMCSLWYLQMIGYIMDCSSCSFVCKLHHLIIIIMQTCTKALNYWPLKYLSGICCRVCVND